MSTPLEALVSVFADSFTPEPRETVALATILARVKDGTYQGQVRRLRRMRERVGKDAYDQAKRSSVAFTPAGVFEKRANAHLLTPSGCLNYDFDEVSDLATAKAQLREDPCIVYAFDSPSGRGLKVAVWASGIVDDLTYKHAWGTVLGYLQLSYPDLAVSNDPNCKDIARLCYVSYDQATYINPDAQLFAVPPYVPPPPHAATEPPDDDAPDFETASTALAFVPGFDDYRTWIRVGMALHSAQKAWGRGLWDGWSAQSDQYDPRVQQRKWQSFSTERDLKVTMGTLLTLAAQHGWRRYTANGTTPQADETPIAPTYPWPTLATEARYGLAGEIVTTLEPHTESDPVALLVQLFVMTGNCIGRAPYFTVEATRHYLNLFVALVGRSSRSRKGTSADHITRLLFQLDETWRACVVGGMSSGEGVIFHVRDSVYGKNRKGEDACLDDGVDDKRLCILESEFARALSKTSQEGNVLSAVLRQAWDNGNLRTLVSGRQKAPTTASNAHVSLCTHITAEELCRLLTDTEAANGFGNRFLWACVQRSKLLPSGGQYPHEALAPLIERLRKVIEFARQVAEMHRTPAAVPRWTEIYTALAEEHPGLLGAITARAEAQVMRLACLYALLDQTSMVDVPHLNAAYALWRYCAQSARFIFGDRLGDPLAEEIRSLLRLAGQEGLTRTAINNAMGRNVKSAVIGQALARLYHDGFARSRVSKTPGRPVETWYATMSRIYTPNELNEFDEKSPPPPDLNSSNSFNSSVHIETQHAEPAPPTGPTVNGPAPQASQTEGYEELLL
jgi:hypothetical protein